MAKVAAENGNKESATQYLKLASTGRVREAFSRYVGPGFKHHVPYFEGTPEALINGLEESGRQNPGKVFEIRRVVAEGDYVVTHSLVRQNAADLGAVVVGIFRFKNGRIAEFWDVARPVQPSSPNENGLF
ncbi:MAG: nuclear transport factor 2 family protein [Nitrososphaerales archaeon]